MAQQLELVQGTPDPAPSIASYLETKTGAVYPMRGGVEHDVMSFSAPNHLALLSLAASRSVPGEESSPDDVPVTKNVFFFSVENVVHIHTGPALSEIDSIEFGNADFKESVSFVVSNAALSSVEDLYLLVGFSSGECSLIRVSKSGKNRDSPFNQVCIGGRRRVAKGASRHAAPWCRRGRKHGLKSTPGCKD